MTFKSSSIFCKEFDSLMYYTFHPLKIFLHFFTICRGGSRAAATSKIERFAIIVNVFQPLTIITKRSILDVAAALDPPLLTYNDSEILKKSLSLKLGNTN